jgi:hypothetical protein
MWAYFTLILCNLLRARHTFKAHIATHSSFLARLGAASRPAPRHLALDGSQIPNHLIAENQNQDRIP